MMYKVLVELSDGSTLVFDCLGLQRLRRFEQEYDYVKTKWVRHECGSGGYLEHYFKERRGDN